MTLPAANVLEEAGVLLTRGELEQVRDGGALRGHHPPSEGPETLVVDLLVGVEEWELQDRLARAIEQARR